MPEPVQYFLGMIALNKDILIHHRSAGAAMGLEFFSQGFTVGLSARKTHDQRDDLSGPMLFVGEYPKGLLCRSKGFDSIFRLVVFQESGSVE